MTKSIGLSKEECINQLQSYCDEIDEITALLDERGFAFGVKREKAQELLTNLKKKLKDDYDSRKTNYGREQMSEVESRYFFHAIHEAHTHIYVKTNSVPSEKWRSELGVARHTINDYLWSLRNPK